MPSREFTEADRERARRIATVALHRAMAGDLPGAAGYVDRLNNTLGLQLAIMGWCDTYIARVPSGSPIRGAATGGVAGA
jgi:hypothetical protein